MRKEYLIAVLVAIVIIASIFAYTNLQKPKVTSLGLAVEYNDHAACGYIAKHKGWFKEEGLNVTCFNTYVTGVALSAALARGDIDAAYLCLGPAIMAYARGVPIKIVAGTHFHGYVIVGKPEIKTLKDLEGKRVGCVREGSQMDLLLHIVIEKYGLKNVEVRRANPPMQVMLLAAGKIDAAFIPEHWATLAASKGFHVIARSQEIWPEMEGSILVVKEDLIRNNPEAVRKLVKITERGTKFINEHRLEAAEILAEEFREASPQGVKAEVLNPQIEAITPELLLKSMDNLEYTTKVDVKVIQEYIDLLYRLGYLDKRLKAEDLVDLSFLGSQP